MKIKQRNNCNHNCIEIKQVFLSSAIGDISTYIQLADIKVSIIIAAVVALIAGVLSCHESIYTIWKNIKPCSWLGVCIIIFAILLIVSIFAIFIFGILTIRGHSSKVKYNSKWYINKSIAEYSLKEYQKDIALMNKKDIIENMAAELYKLNDINRQKALTNRFVMISFSVTVVSAIVICACLVISLLGR